MSPSRAKSNVKRSGRQPSALGHLNTQGNTPFTHAQTFLQLTARSSTPTRYWKKGGAYTCSYEHTSPSAIGDPRATPSTSFTNKHHSRQKGTFYSPSIHNMTADSSLRIRTVHQTQSDLPIHIESESEVKSLDRIKTLRSEHLAVRACRTRRDLSGSEYEPRLQILFSRAQYAQISVVTPRAATSTRSNTGSKKEAGLENISSRTAT